MLPLQVVSQTNSQISFLADKLVTFTNENLHSGLGGEIDRDTSLLTVGILDSLSMISLMTFIESEFGVQVPDEAVIPENFEHIQAIAELVAELKGAKTPENAKESPLQESIRILEASGVKRQWVDLDSGERMHVLQVAGEEPTWVLLPGMGNPSTSWGTMLRSLTDDHAAIAVDYAGFGLSSCLQERPTFDDHFHATLALLETIAEPPFVLVGNSAGSLIASRIARHKPEWIHALIITGFGLIEKFDAWHQRYTTFSSSPEAFLEAAYYRPPKLTGTLRRLLDDALTSPAYHSFFKHGGLTAMPTAFENLRVPTLFVASQDDQIIPPSAVIAAAKQVPNARLEWLARCGHFPPIEQPDELLYLIRNFLRELRNQG